MSKTWYRISRNLTEDTTLRSLSSLEFAALVTLTGLADHRTGGYRTNGPSLRHFLPDLTKSSAQRILESLQNKGYIYRDVTPRSQQVYPYWIEGFPVTAGKHKGLQLDLSEVFESKDTSRRRYVKHDPESEPVSGPQGEPVSGPQGMNKNKKQEERSKKEESIKLLPYIQNGDIASPTAGYGDRMPHSANLIGRRPDGAECVGLVPVASTCIPSSAVVEPTPPPPKPVPVAVTVSSPAPQPPASVAVDIRYTGEDEDYRNSEDRPVPRYAINALIAPLNLVTRTTRKGFEFFTLDDNQPVPRDAAHSAINAGYFEYVTRQHAS